MKKCAVIGSVNFDMVVGMPRFPKPGETLQGSSFATVPGGKGANQAVALGRLGTPVMMAGKVGDDGFGRQYLSHFKEENVDVSAVSVEAGVTTGLADIHVAASGENCIVIIPGANALCDEAWLDEALAATADCDIFLLQLEIPLDTVKTAMKRLHEAGKTVILDPAPAVALPREVLDCADNITPNETELCILTSDLPEDAEMEARIKHLIGDSDRVVIHKRGAAGAFICTRDGIAPMSGYKVKAVDTTAAGDTFNAGFAAGLSRNMSLTDAVRLANAAGAISVTGMGAQSAMPTFEQAATLAEV